MSVLEEYVGEETPLSGLIVFRVSQKPISSSALFLNRCSSRQRRKKFRKNNSESNKFDILDIFAAYIYLG